MEEMFTYDNMDRLTGIDLTRSAGQGGDSLRYSYGFDRQRMRVEEFSTGWSRTKDYVGRCEFVTESGASGTFSRSLTFVTGPCGVFAVVEADGQTQSVHYVLKDNLGSWSVVTDGDGNVEQRLGYDAWGNPRDPSTWVNHPASGGFGKPMFDRGFTGHEYLPLFGLINMNGRVYDPATASFLSPDRYMQDPTSAQGFNRYAYCMNNPLRYVDPSGWRPRQPIVGSTPSSADFIREIYAFSEKAYEPRDFGIHQLPTSDAIVVWMEENQLHGVGGTNINLSSKEKEQDDEEMTKKQNGDNPPKGIIVHSGRNLLAKAYWHYQFGGKEDYWVDASTLDLDYISFENLNDNSDGTYWVNLFDHSKTAQSALALGKITLIPVGDNQYEIVFDEYDFNIEWEQGWTTRNKATLGSGLLHGPVIDNKPIPTHWMGGRPCYAQPSVYFGGPFEIHFSKTVYIKP